MQSDTKDPCDWQFCPTSPESWRAGAGIVALCGALCLWFLTLAVRFTDDDALAAALVWLVLVVVWLGSQIALARTRVLERHAGAFTTIWQAILPTAATVFAAFAVPSFRDAAVSVATGVGVAELVAIHTLRLAAWGTIRKYRQRQLPRYFYRFGSLPDFGFAVLAAAFALALAVEAVEPSGAFLIMWNLVGAAAFLGAAVTMYFGVPGSVLSIRWHAVENGREAPTLLPFRWPMNLAPAFCGPAFWIAHALLIVKVVRG